MPAQSRSSILLVSGSCTVFPFANPPEQAYSVNPKKQHNRSHLPGCPATLSGSVRSWAGLAQPLHMSSCKMKCCYKVFRSRKFQNLVQVGNGKFEHG